MRGTYISVTSWLLLLLSIEILTSLCVDHRTEGKVFPEFTTLAVSIFKAVYSLRSPVGFCST